MELSIIKPFEDEKWYLYNLTSRSIHFEVRDRQRHFDEPREIHKIILSLKPDGFLVSIHYEQDNYVDVEFSESLRDFCNRCFDNGSKMKCLIFPWINSFNDVTILIHLNR